LLLDDRTRARRNSTPQIFDVLALSASFLQPSDGRARDKRESAIDSDGVPVKRENLSTVWLPVVDAFRTFCTDPGPEGAALLSEVHSIALLAYAEQNQRLTNSPGDLR
jgi:hypothetical protein